MSKSRSMQVFYDDGTNALSQHYSKAQYCTNLPTLISILDTTYVTQLSMHSTLALPVLVWLEHKLKSDKTYIAPYISIHGREHVEKRDAAGRYLATLLPECRVRRDRMQANQD